MERVVGNFGRVVVRVSTVPSYEVSQWLLQGSGVPNQDPDEKKRVISESGGGSAGGSPYSLS